MTLPFTLDAGAKTVMLSKTYIEHLGFVAGELKNDRIETSQDLITARLGRLDSLTAGPVTTYGATVAFADHGTAGGLPVLGMRFLSRFSISLEDGNNGLEFISK